MLKVEGPTPNSPPKTKFSYILHSRYIWILRMSNTSNSC